MKTIIKHLLIFAIGLITLPTILMLSFWIMLQVFNMLGETVHQIINVITFCIVAAGFLVVIYWTGFAIWDSLFNKRR